MHAGAWDPIHRGLPQSASDPDVGLLAPCAAMPIHDDKSLQIAHQAPRGPGGAPGVSLLQRIDTCCRRMALPRQLRGRPEFEFLL